MADLTLKDMHQMQRELQEKYKEKWGGLSPKIGRNQLLWMYGEMAEVGDIIKKKGEQAIMEDEGVRGHFVEELCDVLMYFNDIMLCFDIAPEELEKTYREKHQRNMKRW